MTKKKWQGVEKSPQKEGFPFAPLNPGAVLPNLADPEKIPYKIREEIQKMYEEGAKEDDPISQYNLGVLAERNNQHQEAIEWYKKAARNNFVPAWNNLAGCYRDGIGVSVNVESAIYWYKKAAEKGYPSSQYNLACIFDHYYGQHRKAFALYKKAADQGFALAAYNVGNYYETGLLGQQDISNAIRYYEIAARKGDNDALKKLRDLDPLHNSLKPRVFISFSVGRSSYWSNFITWYLRPIFFLFGIRYFDCRENISKTKHLDLESNCYSISLELSKSNFFLRFLDKNCLPKKQDYQINVDSWIWNPFLNDFSKNSIDYLNDFEIIKSYDFFPNNKTRIEVLLKEEVKDILQPDNNIVYPIFHTKSSPKIKLALHIVKAIKNRWSSNENFIKASKCLSIKEEKKICKYWELMAKWNIPLPDKEYRKYSNDIDTILSSASIKTQAQVIGLLVLDDRASQDILAKAVPALAFLDEKRDSDEARRILIAIAVASRFPQLKEFAIYHLLNRSRGLRGMGAQFRIRQAVDYWNNIAPAGRGLFEAFYEYLASFSGWNR